MNILHLSAGRENIKKKHFGANDDSIYWPVKYVKGKCVCGGGGWRGDGLPWCSSPQSHGVEVETVGFLPLLSVVSFLLLPVEDADDDEDEDANSD